MAATLEFIHEHSLKTWPHSLVLPLGQSTGANLASSVTEFLRKQGPRDTRSQHKLHGIVDVLVKIEVPMYIVLRWMRVFPSLQHELPLHQPTAQLNEFLALTADASI